MSPSNFWNVDFGCLMLGSQILIALPANAICLPSRDHASEDPPERCNSKNDKQSPVAASQIRTVLSSTLPDLVASRLPSGDQEIDSTTSPCFSTPDTQSPVAMSQILIVLSADASRRPSGDQSVGRTGPLCPLRIDRQAPLLGSQTLTVSSFDVERVDSRHATTEWTDTVLL
jgi:hypothetical protein